MDHGGAFCSCGHHVMGHSHLSPTGYSSLVDLRTPYFNPEEFSAPPILVSEPFRRLKWAKSSSSSKGNAHRLAYASLIVGINVLLKTVVHRLAHVTSPSFVNEFWRVHRHARLVWHKGCGLHARIISLSYLSRTPTSETRARDPKATNRARYRCANPLQVI